MYIGMEEQGLRLLDTSERCLCPGESLTYECTVMGEPDGPGSTVWMGSAFDCTSREISLFHNKYEAMEGISGTCGGIMGRSESVVNVTNDDNSTTYYYISQLTVPIDSSITGQTIECLYYDSDRSSLVGTAKIKGN